MSRNSPTRPPLRITGIVFAFALNLFLVSVVHISAGNLGLLNSLWIAAALVAALVAGLVTTFYVRERSGIHAFLGGVLSVPVLAIFILGGNWSFALLAGSFCAVGGIVGEYYRRRR